MRPMRWFSGRNPSCMVAMLGALGGKGFCSQAETLVRFFSRWTCMCTEKANDRQTGKCRITHKGFPKSAGSSKQALLAKV